MACSAQLLHTPAGASARWRAPHICSTHLQEPLGDGVLHPFVMDLAIWLSSGGDGHCTVDDLFPKVAGPDAVGTGYVLLRFCLAVRLEACFMAVADKLVDTYGVNPDELLHR